MSPTRRTPRIVIALALALGLASLLWTSQPTTAASIPVVAPVSDAAVPQDPAPTGSGGVQIIKTVCKTGEPDHETTFSINQPKAVERPDVRDVSGCARGANAVFRLTNVTTTGFVDLVTGADGEASANRLAAGPYTLIEESTGATAAFEVVDGRSTIVSVTNFDYPPSGTLEVVGLFCPGQAETFISVDWPNETPPGDPNGTVSQSPGGCQFGDATVTVIDAHDNAIWETTTAPSGLAVVDLPPGNYIVRVSVPGPIAGAGIVAVDQNTKVILTNPVVA